MHTDTRSILAKKGLLMEHLTKQGFTVALTHTGFIAVDQDGIVFTVSPVRTHVQMVHPKTGQLSEHRSRGMPDTDWFDSVADEFVDWSKA